MSVVVRTAALDPKLCRLHGPFEEIVVRDTRTEDGRGRVSVWLIGNVVSFCLERFRYGNADDYDGIERDALRVCLSALTHACWLARSLETAAGGYHLSRECLAVVAGYGK